jgi:hypothetical protein
METTIIEMLQDLPTLHIISHIEATLTEDIDFLLFILF